MKILILILISSTIWAQNLVQNSSFELHSNCPTVSEQIYLVTDWNRPPNATGTPDYFNSCNTGYYGVPNNSWGIQQSFEGNAYIGLVTYYVGTGITFDYREYIETQLSSPLVAGELYQLTFYVSLSDISQLASNNIGAVFTVDQLTGNGNAQPLTLTPNILNQSIVSNTLDWVQISGSYLANGNEQYLTIGNFFSNSETQTQISNPSFSFPLSYYFIDNISVINSALGDENFVQKKVEIFPNPVTDKFTISSIENDLITNIDLYSTYNIVKHLNCNEKIFDIESLSTGIYYLIISYESGKKYLTKIIKI